MPNEINSENWTIDSFSQTVTFPVIISATGYRDFIFSRNLPDVDDTIKEKLGYTLDDRGLEYEAIPTLGNLDPGNLDPIDGYYLAEGNFPITHHQIRDISLLKKENKYGPPTLEIYTSAGEPIQGPDTGFLQYKTSAGGDFRATLVGQQLGFGIGAGIDFDSPLSDSGKEFRKDSVIDRVKTNAANETIGRINLDPFGLLAGQDIFLKDYKITVPKSGVGKVLDFASDLVGFSVPASPIPFGAFGLPSNVTQQSPCWHSTPEGYEPILEVTGKGTKTLLFDALLKNKYKPGVAVPYPLPKKSDNIEDAPAAGLYTEPIVINTEKEKVERNKPLVDKINQAIGGSIDAIVGGGRAGKDSPAPSEFDKPVTTYDDIATNKEMGFDSLGVLIGSGAKDTWDIKGPGTIEKTGEKKLSTQITPPGTELTRSKIEGLSLVPQTDTFSPKTTPTFKTVEIDLLRSDDGTIGTSVPFELMPNTELPYKDDMFWGKKQDGINPFKKGILKYTQSLVNQADSNSKSRFIGATNSDANYATDGTMKDYSMGNTTTNNENTYCRSWSTRRPYKNNTDLVRHQQLINNSGGDTKLMDLSTLKEGGRVKIAWEHDGEYEKNVLDKIVEGNTAHNEASQYMLSLENLAWRDSPHFLKLPKCEVGPHGGRIMWFPPYEINFTDNTSVNWDTTNFIGRGEPIYTYNNTERMGTLSFSVIIDHPDILNGEIKNATKDIERFFAGCSDIDTTLFNPYLSPDEINELSKLEDISQPDVPAPTITEPPVENAHGWEVFFENAQNNNGAFPPTGVGRTIDVGYENGYLEVSCQCLSNTEGTEAESFWGYFTGDTINGMPCYRQGFNDLFFNGGEGTLEPAAAGPQAGCFQSSVRSVLKPCPTTFSPSFCGMGNEFFCESTNTTPPLSGESVTVLIEPASTNDVFDAYNLFEVKDGEYKIDRLAEFLTGTGEFEGDDSGKYYKIELIGSASKARDTKTIDTKCKRSGRNYNQCLSEDRIYSTYKYLLDKMIALEGGRAVKIKAVGDINGGETHKLESSLAFGENDLKDNGKAWGIPVSSSQGLTLSSSPGNRRWKFVAKGDSEALSPSDTTPEQLGDYDVTKCNTDSADPNSYTSKFDRRTTIKLTAVAAETWGKIQEDLINKYGSDTDKGIFVREEIAETTAKRVLSECDYFLKIRDTDDFVYDSIKEKIKNFHPAFHAMSPSGFNNRLTFLHQCTRQGPQINDVTQPQNMAFGKPPVCVLRLGDFYHTKIVIDAINMTFDPLLWDLNPEGMGVQPMVAKIDLNFKFIGGSSLGGPILQLQNAVSFNFLANTSLYNPATTFTADVKGQDRTFVYGAFGTPEQENKIVSGIQDIKQKDAEKTVFEVPEINPADRVQVLADDKRTEKEVKEIDEGFSEEEQTKKTNLILDGFSDCKVSSEGEINSTYVNPGCGSGIRVYINEKFMEFQVSEDSIYNFTSAYLSRYVVVPQGTGTVPDTSLKEKQVDQLYDTNDNATAGKGKKIRLYTKPRGEIVKVWGKLPAGFPNVKDQKELVEEWGYTHRVLLKGVADGTNEGLDKEIPVETIIEVQIPF